MEKYIIYVDPHCSGIQVEQLGALQKPREFLDEMGCLVEGMVIDYVVIQSGQHIGIDEGRIDLT